MTRRIDAAPKRVFELIERPDRQKLWMHGLEQVTFLDGGSPPSQVGRRFRQRVKQAKGQVGTYDGEITAYERPFLYGYSVGNERFRMHVEYRIEALDARTSLVHYRADAHEGGFLNQFMGTVFRPLAKQVAKEQLKRLSSLAEAR